MKLGLSLGSVNYVLSNLVDAGFIRAKRFKNSKNKIAYMYILTPAGIKSKMQLSRAFLKRKLDEYEMLDEDFLKLATTEKRILITNDKDFGELTFLQKRLSTGIILIRVKGQKAQIKVKLIKKLLQNYSDKILGHFVVVTREKFRFVTMEDIR